MSWLNIPSPSLLDTADNFPVEWWLIYGKTERSQWWNSFLHKDFQHVQAMRRDGSIWIHFAPHCEFLDIKILRTDANPWQLFPGHKIQRVVMLRKEGILRSPWHTGAITCVELVKALLGIRAWYVRTPRQLFNYCRRHSLWAANQSRQHLPKKRFTCANAKLKIWRSWTRRRTEGSRV